MRSAAIIWIGENVAMIARIRAGRIYSLFPRGTVGTGETLEMTVVREVREELGLEMCVEQLAPHVEFNGQSQFYYWANQVAGEFGTGDGGELNFKADSPGGSFRPVWI